MTEPALMCQKGSPSLKRPSLIVLMVIRKIASYLGLMTSIGAFTYALFVIYKTLAFGEPVQGYPTLMVVVLFLGGVQLMSLGVIGEYLGRMFNETKQRPLYFVNSFSPSTFQNESE